MNVTTQKSNYWPRASHKFYDWFMAEGSLAPLILVRKALGLVMAVAYTFTIPNAHRMFNAEALGNPRAVMAALPQSVTMLFLGILILSALFFAAGYKTKWSGGILLILHFGFVELVFNQSWGWGLIVPAWIVYIMCAKPHGPMWPLRLLQIHLCLVYFVAGFGRLNNVEWHQGEVALELLSNTFYGRFEIDFYPLKRIVELLGISTWILEICSPFALLIPGLNRWWALVLIAFHISLFIFISIGWWQLIMISALLSYSPCLRAQSSRC